MEKTVLVAAANTLSSSSCGHSISFELTTSGKGSGSNSSNSSKGPSSRIITKTLWTSCVESVCEYCRIVFDLFPDQYQVCVAAVDESKCQPVNSWRDEDQDMNKVLSGFQKFGPPRFESQQQMRGQSHNPIHPCIQGMQYAVRCLAQLTATQYAASVCSNRKPLVNQGRIVFLCSLKSASDVKELEKVIVNMVRSENADIKQKHDPARLHIQHCQLVLINTYSPHGPPNEVKDSPLTQLSSQVSSVIYSFPGKLLLEKCVHLAKMHFDLKSTVITGIPMKEEQTGGSSTNYDVELLHCSEAHRDILRAGYGLGPTVISRKDSSKDVPKDLVMLKWSTPKSTSLDLQFCTSAYRVTPCDVTSRPTICLINFVLSGKPVLLEQPKKGSTKVVSHVLNSHRGAIFLHCIPTSRSYLDDPPSISEGWGGRVTDYRISDFTQILRDNVLVPTEVDRTKIPDVFPIDKSLKKLEYDTRHWPLVYNDTLVFTLKQDLDPLPDLVVKENITELELEEAKKVVEALQAKEAANEPLSVPSSGGRNKGVKRDEQYRALWFELETLCQLYSTNSERHRQLVEFITQAIAHSPSMQQPRKLPTAVKSEPPTPSTSRTELAWQELDRYQGMTTREKRDFNHHHPANEDNHRPAPSNLSLDHPREVTHFNQKPLPVPAKPVATLLSLWTAKLHRKASVSHAEFAGRVSFGERAELYSKMKSTSVVPPLEQDS